MALLKAKEQKLFRKPVHDYAIFQLHCQKLVLSHSFNLKHRHGKWFYGYTELNMLNMPGAVEMG